MKDHNLTPLFVFPLGQLYIQPTAHLLWMPWSLDVPERDNVCSSLSLFASCRESFPHTLTPPILSGVCLNLTPSEQPSRSSLEGMCYNVQPLSRRFVTHNFAYHIHIECLVHYLSYQEVGRGSIVLSTAWKRLKSGNFWGRMARWRADERRANFECSAAASGWTSIHLMGFQRPDYRNTAISTILSQSYPYYILNSISLRSQTHLWELIVLLKVTLPVLSKAVSQRLLPAMSGLFLLSWD